MRVLLILFLIFSIICQANSQDLLGVDDNSVLNKRESVFLDSLLQSRYKEVDLTNNRVAFLYGGSTGNAFQSKSKFFNQNVLPWTRAGHTPSLILINLTEDEKKATGGYDALLIAWAKVFTEKRKRIMLTKLANNNRTGE